MGDLRDMVSQYSIKQDCKIKKICAPLKDHLGISIFRYMSIEQNGCYAHLSNHAESMKFYYDEKFYQNSPFLVHPHLFRSGSVLIPHAFDTEYMKVWRDYSQVLYTFCILHHHGDSIESFFFETTTSDKTHSFVFFNYMELLNKFISYFKREAAPLLRNVKGDGFNIKEAKGAAFLEGSPLLPLSNKDPNVQRFLKIMMPLSYREQQCLSLYKQGHSAQSTGAMLGLSSRTVEFYFNNIKNKLGCSSKSELMEW